MSKLQWKQKVYRDSENLYIINFISEELDLGEDATIIDIMEWMINTQLGRRNLPPAQRLAVVEKFKKKIQEEAKEKQSESNKQFYGNQYKVASSSNGEQSTTKIHTDKELAKLSGVGTGTVARYDAVMKSGDEELEDVTSLLFNVSL